MAITRSTANLDVRGIQSSTHYLMQDGPDTAPVILLLHGHSSSVDEFQDLLPALDGKAVVFAFDQPSCGGSSEGERQKVLDVYGAFAWAKHYEALFYLRDLVRAFVWTVIRPHIAATGRGVRVAGGSLGGNLTLLVAESATKYPWLEAAYCWSPGSAWAPGLKQSLGAQVARGRAVQPWGQADIEPFLATTFVNKAVPTDDAFPQPWYWYFDCWGEDSHPECLKVGGGACSRCQHQPKLLLKGGKLLGPSNNYTRMGEKKARHIEGALLSTEARLRPARMGWHWEIAAEQVELSHRQKLTSGRRRVELLQCPTMFMAGKEDRHFPAALFHDTRACYQMALDRRSVDPNAARVSAKWFDASGHSLHNERPNELAAVLAGAAL